MRVCKLSGLFEVLAMSGAGYAHLLEHERGALGEMSFVGVGTNSWEHARVLELCTSSALLVQQLRSCVSDQQVAVQHRKQNAHEAHRCPRGYRSARRACASGLAMLPRRTEVSHWVNYRRSHFGGMESVVVCAPAYCVRTFAVSSNS
jgi:hypothetical protein